MAKANFDFQKAFKELESLSEWFGRDNIDLDEALNKYRRGLALIKETRKHLKETENEFRAAAKSTED